MNNIIKKFPQFNFLTANIIAALFPVVLGDVGCDVICQACQKNSPLRYCAWFQASSACL